MTHRSDPSQRIIVLLSLCALALVAVTPGGIAVADDVQPRITETFDNEPLNDVLAALEQACGAEFRVEPGVDIDTPITATIIDLPLDHALDVVLGSAGMAAVEDDGGWLIRDQERPDAAVGTDLLPLAGPAAASPPPPPTRSVSTYEPQRGPAVTEEADERETVMEILWPEHLGADEAAMIFGGGIIEAGGYFGTAGTTGTTGGYGSTGQTGFGSRHGGGFGQGQGFGASQRFGTARDVGVDRTTSDTYDPGSRIAPTPDISEPMAP